MLPQGERRALFRRGGNRKRLEGALLSRPLSSGKGTGKSMGLTLWVLRSLVLSRWKGNSSFPVLAQFQAFGTWGDRAGHLLGGPRHIRKPLLQDRHMLKWFPESRSWSQNWKWQVEVPLPADHSSWGCEWNRDVKTTSSAGWRSKCGGFRLTWRQLGKVKFRISSAGLYVGVHSLL